MHECFYFYVYSACDVQNWSYVAAMSKAMSNISHWMWKHCHFK